MQCFTKVDQSTFAKFAPLIRSIVDTATSLADANAAFLVQATEQVEITDDMRLRFAALLRSACAACAAVTAAFLFRRNQAPH
jgi:hypothetical protein